MRDYKDILNDEHVGSMRTVEYFIRHTGTKLVWIFGSVTSLVVLSATLTAADGVNNTSADATTAMTQQYMQPQPDAAADQSIEQHDGVQTTRIEGVASTSPSPADVTLRVNNVPVPLPKQGVIHKDIRSTDGTTSVDVTINAQSSGGSSSQSSSIMLQTTTESTSNTVTNRENDP